MPYDDPDPADPQMLVGVTLPGSAAATREMAETFADEFAQLGLDRDRILALYRQPFYAGAHQAWQHLGNEEIARIVDESLRVWGRYRFVVRDSVDDAEEAQTESDLVRPGGFLKVLS
jgi:hypothetical protein